MPDAKISELPAVTAPTSTNELAVNESAVSKKLTVDQIQGGTTEGAIPFVGQAGVFKQDSPNLFWDDTNDRLGIGTSSPNSTLEVRGAPGDSVGGFASGQLHVTNQSANVNASAVITGHNLFGGNKQLWYLGSSSSSDENITFINRQNAALFLGTDNISRLTILSGGEIGIGTISPESILHISTGVASVVNPTSQADDLIIQSDGDVGITLFSPNANVSSIVFGSPGGTGNEGARIRWSNTNVLLSIATTEAAADIIFAPGFLAESMRLRPDGRVGIGTDLPQARLHVKTGDAGAVGAPTGGDELLVEGSANTGITIISPATSFSQLIFGSPAGLGGEGAKIRWKDSTALFEIETTESGADIVFKPGTASEAMRIRSDGAVIIGSQIPSGTALLEMVSTTKALMLPRWTAAQEISNTGSLGTGDKGLLWFNTTSNFLKMWNGTAIVAIA